MGLVKYRDYLEERYVNLLPQDEENKEEYADEVWDLLNKSYAAIGGLIGNGFSSKEDMIKNIPMWKLVRKNGKIIVALMYKDKGGRKSVAIGTDGSHEAKRITTNILKQEIKRSYGEKSKAALGMVMKLIPWDALEPFIKTPKEVSKIMSDDEIIPIKGYKGTLPPDAKQTLTKYPQLINYGYLRELGGNLRFKVMIGTPGKNIK